MLRWKQNPLPLLWKPAKSRDKLQTSSIWLQLNFLTALFGTMGSLYFSEIMKLPPCTLCWYQRACLYPLAIIFAVALWSEDKSYRKYAWPLALLGLGISSYHNLLYYGYISEVLSPCTQGGVSCSTKQLELFGFLTIPLLSLTSFILTIVCLIKDKKKREYFL